MVNGLRKMIIFAIASSKMPEKCIFLMYKRVNTSSMKRYLFTVLSFSILLSFTGCYQSQKKEIDDIASRVSALTELCKEYNSNLQALSTVLSAYENYDYISSISKISTGSGGYAINFLKGGTITIYNGTSGKAPIVNTKLDTDGQYYWTVQYSGGEAQWLLDENENKVQAVGSVPTLKITEGYWYVSYDSQSWYRLGKADGDNGDPLFKEVFVGSGYVLFYLWGGSELKIPMSVKYTELINQIAKTNENSETLWTLLSKLESNLMYIEDVERFEDSDSKGYKVYFSDGDQIVIYDWEGSNVPVISMKRYSDGKYYWTVTVAPGEEPVWILDSYGYKVSAEESNVSIPEVVVKTDKDNQLYWAVVNARDTTFILDSDKQKVLAKHGTGATFSMVDNSSDEYFKILLTDGTSLLFAKKYTFEFEYFPGTIEKDKYVDIKFTLYGGDENIDYMVVCQGDVTAAIYPDSGGSGGVLRIYGKEVCDTGKVMVIAYADNNSVKVAVKTIRVKVV